jgi:hypothetical protein
MVQYNAHGSLAGLGGLRHQSEPSQKHPSGDPNGERRPDSCLCMWCLGGCRRRRRRRRTVNSGRRSETIPMVMLSIYGGVGCSDRDRQFKGKSTPNGRVPFQRNENCTYDSKHIRRFRLLREPHQQVEVQGTVRIRDGTQSIRSAQDSNERRKSHRYSRITYIR